MANPDWNQELVTKVLASAHTPYRQDILDGTYHSTNKLAVSAATPIRLQIDGTGHNYVNGPDHLSTQGYDTINDKFAAPNELDGPTYKAKVSFVFDSGTAAGQGIVRVWIDDTVPKLVSSYPFAFPITEQPIAVETSWYLGEETGYDAKNDGVYWTIEFDNAGDIWNMAILVNR